MALCSPDVVRGQRLRGALQHYVGWSVLAVLLSACMLEPEASPVQGRSAEIIDGTAHPGDPGVMFLIADNALCTGALIAPRVILTAKHCILDVEPETVIVGMGESLFSGTRYANVTEIRTTSGSRIEDKDIAVLLLDHAGSAQPYEWVSEKNSLHRNDAITLIGYGQQMVGESGTGPSGTKQLGTSRITRVYPQELAISGPTTCFGDSGGPGFLEDGRIAGVVSRGVTACDGPSLLTRTDAFRALLEQAVADTGGDTLAPPITDTPTKDETLTHSGETVTPTEDAEVNASDEATNIPQSSEGCAVANASSVNSPLWILWTFALLWIGVRRTHPTRARVVRRPGRIYNGARANRSPWHP